MNPRYYSLAVVFAFAVISIPLAQAADSPAIDSTLVGNSEIDLNWEEKDRVVRAFAQFNDFDIDDRSFTMDIIQSSTGKTVASSNVYVYSTSDGLVDFGSMVSYMVNDRDICTYDMSEADEDDVCTNVMTGAYEMVISTKAGESVSEQFSIVDNRA